MTRWEYFTSLGGCSVEDASRPDGMDYMNAMGKEGWELVTIISRPGLPERAVFKRPVETVAKAKKGTK